MDRLYYVDIEGGIDSYYARFTSKRRHNLRRAIRLFVEQGGASLPDVAVRPDEMEQFHKAASAISKRTYQSTLLRAGLPEDRAFLAGMQELASQDLARGYLLRFRGEPVAFAWCRGQGDRLTYDVVGYLPEYSRWSPGTVLLCLILEHQFREKRFRYLDFGPGEGWYKEAFCTGCWESVDAMVFRDNLKHRLLVAAHQKVEGVSAAAGRMLDRLGLKEAARKLVRRMAAVRAPRASH